MANSRSDVQKRIEREDNRTTNRNLIADGSQGMEVNPTDVNSTKILADGRLRSENPVKAEPETVEKDDAGIEGQTYSVSATESQEAATNLSEAQRTQLVEILRRAFGESASQLGQSPNSTSEKEVPPANYLKALQCLESNLSRVINSYKAQLEIRAAAAAQQTESNVTLVRTAMKLVQQQPGLRGILANVVGAGTSAHTYLKSLDPSLAAQPKNDDLSAGPVASVVDAISAEPAAFGDWNGWKMACRLQTLSENVRLAIEAYKRTQISRTIVQQELDDAKTHGVSYPHQSQVEAIVRVCPESEVAELLRTRLDLNLQPYDSGTFPRGHLEWVVSTIVSARSSLERVAGELGAVATATTELATTLTICCPVRATLSLVEEEIESFVTSEAAKVSETKAKVALSNARQDTEAISAHSKMLAETSGIRSLPRHADCSADFTEDGASCVTASTDEEASQNLQQQSSTSAVAWQLAGVAKLDGFLDGDYRQWAEWQFDTSIQCKEKSAHESLTGWLAPVIEPERNADEFANERRRTKQTKAIINDNESNNNNEDVDDSFPVYSGAEYLSSPSGSSSADGEDDYVDPYVDDQAGKKRKRVLSRRAKTRVASSIDSITKEEMNEVVVRVKKRHKLLDVMSHHATRLMAEVARRSGLSPYVWYLMSRRPELYRHNVRSNHVVSVASNEWEWSKLRMMRGDEVWAEGFKKFCQDIVTYVDGSPVPTGRTEKKKYKAEAAAVIRTFCDGTITPALQIYMDSKASDYAGTDAIIPLLEENAPPL